MLNQEEISKVLSFVKEEPRTVQEVSHFIGKSWVTTDTYLKNIQNDTGLIGIKTFRKGSHGALKVVFYNSTDAVATDSIKDELFQKIKFGRKKQDFDFLDVYQYVPDDKKVVSTKDIETEFTNMLNQAKSLIFFFSGNLSFITKKTVIKTIEDLIKNKIRIKILCRINLASINNIKKLEHLIVKYPEMIEIRHAYHPLRGFIVDDNFARFKDEENVEQYREDELDSDTKIIYTIHDTSWVSWLKKIFWNMFKTSIDYKKKTQEIEKMF